jgi:hypothetical protein
MKLNQDQFDALLEAHVRRIVDEMDMTAMVQLVYDTIAAVYVDDTGNMDEYSQPAIVEDILNHEGWDIDEAFRFISDVNCMPDSDAEKLLREHLENNN